MSNLFQPDEPIPDLVKPKTTNRGKKFSDDELTKLAHNANLYIRWPGIENDDDPINAMITAKGRTASLRNVYNIGGGFSSGKKVVKVTICGKQYRICISIHRLRLARYADAATLYFWKYKSTDRAPEDSDFNTSLAIAQTLMDYPPCKLQLQFLEKFLLDCGGIRPEWEKAADEKAHDFIRDLRVARKYLERSRRYVRLLSERYSLDRAKTNAVEMVIVNITASLSFFSDTIQADAQSVVEKIRQESLDTATASAPVKTEFDILCEQAAERARIARAELAKQNDNQ